MLETGEKIGELTHVLKRQESESNVNNVNQQVRLKDVDIPHKKEIVVKIKVHNYPKDDGTLFEAKTYSAEPGFSIPMSVIRELELHPGHSVKLELFEAGDEGDEEYEISDDVDVIDRVFPTEDNSSQTGIDSRIYSQKARKYLASNGGRAEIAFRNNRTGDEIEIQSHCNYDGGGNAISFPSKVHKTINIESGDVVEILKPTGDTSTDTDTASDSEEQTKIDEIHDMVSEMYEAYLENKND